MTERGEMKIEEGRDDLPFQIHWELDDAPLTVDAFRVYAHLVRCAGRDGLVFPSYLTIGEKCFRASVGAKANPRSLRNRAMKAMRELVDTGLVLKQARTKKGREENDSNIYVLAPRRQWIEGIRARRAALEAQTLVMKASRKGAEKEAGGTLVMPPSIPTMPPPGIPAMPRGIPAMPEVTSTEVPQSFEVISKESSSEEAPEDARPIPLADDDDLSPDGGTPECTPEDTDAEGGEDLLLDQLVGSGVEGGESGTAEGVEDVPPAAAAPVENPVETSGTHAWAILALEPVPLADLQARPARDPEGLKVLRALMQASSAKRLGHLREQLALPGTHRHLLPRLTDAELDRAAKAASHDAARIPGGMPNAGYYALDRLLGKAFTPEMLSGQRPPAPQPALGHAYDVKNEGARPVPVQQDAPVDAAIEAEGALAAGKIWRHKASGTLVRIERIDGMTVHLDGGDSLSIAKFSTTHVKHTAQQAAS
ncbi:hypothetical protein GCM10008959_25600 [Deinococcus seoulensis]|uniref:Helix-turn-helix domain-containing protein n=1 Tax=Deinococcus seoulensis TaxID=1837379 RepID=A0ABQ2RU63_9DEIO|nr:hypothetical protein [Deinococcus seoulensis]GGR62483.1 hypothetical protein GCM10008959_25600 [Deinococcus seoulensis]